LTRLPDIMLQGGSIAIGFQISLCSQSENLTIERPESTVLSLHIGIERMPISRARALE
jgi:hypothetical protein